MSESITTTTYPVNCPDYQADHVGARGAADPLSNHPQPPTFPTKPPWPIVSHGQ